MNYQKIEKYSVSNGDGIRVVLWCSGCKICCKNCHNKNTWDKNSGKLYTEETEKELFEALNHPYISGITFSGGHPLEDYNIDEVTRISKKIKERFPDKTQWLYTGYHWNDIKDLEIIKYLDVVVDGPYIEELKDLTLKWRGSSNQNIWKKQKGLWIKEI